eukprot:TRINITY_DN1273_c0_g1_i1.p1 TRINITY_DN1273_c0_g1~~TRINITY_DN1273_c0_g1_i1.p1  ORF type:complete len:366 (-),score=83.90 TRINITY_DN1273_c0_g1_i1:87-1184(-)
MGNTVSTMLSQCIPQNSLNQVWTGPSEGSSMLLPEERRVALKAVLTAAEAVKRVQAGLVSEETISKKDQSPVTVGDYTAQAVIIHALTQAFPHYPFIAEEDSQTLESQPDVLASVLRFTKDYVPEITESELLATLEKGTNEGVSTKRWWTLDPIDGTQGFLRRDQYAIALALMEDNKPILGILGCPSLDMGKSVPGAEGTIGCVLIAVKGEGAFMRSLTSEKEHPIQCSSKMDIHEAVFTESFVSRGFAHEVNSRIVERLGITASPLRIDSQCKYAMVARGDSDVYLRLSSLDYQECIWDHAAGALIVEEAGGKVTDFRGNELDYSKGRKLSANVGIVCANKIFHPILLEAISRLDILEQSSSSS